MKERVKKEKTQVLELIKKTFKNFRFNFLACTYFEICYRLLTAFVFVPLLYFIVKYFMKSSGVFALTNKDFLTFGLTFQGIITIFILLVIAFIMIFIEIGALTYIGSKSHKGEKVKVIDVIFNILGILKDTLDIGMIPLIIITGVIGPLTGIGLSSSLIKNFTIPPFITIELDKTIGGKIIYALILIILLILLLRWILSIPIVVIENVKGKNAVKKSYKLYKKNRCALFRGIIIWTLVISLTSIIILGIILGVGMGVGEYILGGNSFESKIFLGGLLILFFIIFILTTLLTTPIFVAFLVEFYYHVREDDVEERDFKTYEYYKNNIFYNIARLYSKIFVALLTIMFIVFSGSVGYSIIFHKVFDHETYVTAHRGASKSAPENSISAIKEAINEGADYAEIDVQTTKDGYVILLHDGTFKRTTGVNKAPREMNLDEIKKLNNGSYFSSKFRDEKVPTLDEVLEVAKGKIKLNIELKPKGKNDELVEKVNNSIKKYHMENEVIISSSNYNSLQEIKKINPNLKVGYIVLAAIGEFEKLNVDFFSLESSLVNSKSVYTLHALGKGVDVFTVNTKELAEEMIYLGVDNIITDDVPLIEETKEKIKEEDKHDYVTLFYEGVLNIIRYAKI